MKPLLCASECKVSNAKCITNVRNNTPALMYHNVYAFAAPRRPRGKPPVKVNSHHLHLSAPAINTKMCQKFHWLELHMDE